MRHILFAFLLAGCASASKTHDASEAFSFALIGDMPYAAADSLRFERVMAEINADASLQWVMHAGDIKTGAASCSDAYLEGRRDWLGRFAHPFVLTPGDNEWTDCHRATAGGHAPLERLGALRSLFFSDPGHTMGKRKMAVESQAGTAGYEEFPENVMWERNGVVFATIHVVGSRNGMVGFSGRTAEDDAEAQRRMGAAVYWLRKAFDATRSGNRAGVFILMHANPGFESYASGAADEAFRPLLDALEHELTSYERPVVLAHGDSHYFRVDKPFASPRTGRTWAQFTRVETFGAANVYWLRVSVDPSDENVFSVRQEIVMP